MQPQTHTPDDYWTIARRVLNTRKELRQMTLEMEKELERIAALRQSRNLAPLNPVTAPIPEQLSSDRTQKSEPSKTIAAEIRKVIEVIPRSTEKS